MISIILAAGYATRMYPLTLHTPKPLLSVGGEPILSRLLGDLDKNCGVDKHILVTNHKFHNHFMAWIDKTPHSRPIELLNDGSTENENRLGAVRDLLLAVETLKEPEDLFVCAADNLLDFSLSELKKYFCEKKTSVMFCYREQEEAKRRRSGVVERGEDGLVIGFEEKPEQPKSEYVAPPFYIVSSRDLPLIRKSIEDGINSDAPGSLIGYLAKQSRVFALDMPGKRYDVGSLETYERLRAEWPSDMVL